MLKFSESIMKELARKQELARVRKESTDIEERLLQYARIQESLYKKNLAWALSQTRN
jgi:hypothetical protein